MRTYPGRRVLSTALADDEQLARVLNTLSDRLAADADFDAALERSPETIDRFEDCVWLLNSNVLNHGVSRLMLDEAAYLYRLVRSLEKPFVVEIGRYRGGTTFLLAAAGGRVLSLDIDPALVKEDERLMRALARFGLADQVLLEIADSHNYAVEPGAYDVVFVDGDHSFDGVRADVERWLPGVAPGGHLILHDAFVPSPDRPWTQPWKVEGVHRFREELLEWPELRLAGRAGTLAHIVRQGIARRRPTRDDALFRLDDGREIRVSQRSARSGFAPALDGAKTVVCSRCSRIREADEWTGLHLSADTRVELDLANLLERDSCLHCRTGTTAPVAA
jgi:predicted O-methyltransferase YrrM